jgi:hypothetical protein
MVRGHVHVLTHVLVQSGLDIMHTVDLGIWVHLMDAIAWKVDQTLKTYDILPSDRVSSVWNKLHERAKMQSLTLIALEAAPSVFCAPWHHGLCCSAVTARGQRFCCAAS